MFRLGLSQQEQRFPGDDTIPQITEGDEYMTLAITLHNASNKSAYSSCG
jgi:hypothetical protein